MERALFANHFDEFGAEADQAKKSGRGKKSENSYSNLATLMDIEEFYKVNIDKTE